MKLKELRKQHSLTQQKLASILGVSRSAIAMWESGGNEPDHEMLMRIANHFCITTDELLGNKVIHASFEKEENLPTAQGDEQDARLVKSILSLPPREKDAVKALVEALEAAHSGSLGLQAHQEELPSQK